MLRQLQLTRGDVGHGILYWIGLILGSFALLAFVVFGLKLFGIMDDKPDAGTLNSFTFLGQQLETLREGETVQVPYGIAKKFFLVSGIPNCPQNVLCLCLDIGCEKISTQKEISGRVFSTVSISGKDWAGVQNLEIMRNGERLTVRKPTLFGPKPPPQVGSLPTV